MKNVTVSMADDVAGWVRVHAAKQGKSGSRLIAQLIEGLMRQSEAYEAAMQQHLTRPRGPLGGADGRPSRDELYDRGAERWARER